VKSQIVLGHFDTWSNIVLGEAVRHGQNIAYMDLYSGPGRYDDGSKSTPLLILEKAIQKADKRPELSKHLVTVFNDKDADTIDALEAEVKKLPGIGKLKNEPIFLNEMVSPETEKYFIAKTKMPSFTFIDPFGYEGLTRNLIKAVITKTWGCDCVFFFSYSSINRALSAPGIFTSHMEALFGEERAAELETKMRSIKGVERGKLSRRAAAFC
jgi:three-Cys-motif partner protein